jgi:dihydrofolate reductase
VRKLIVQEWMTLDGVIQAPGMKDEDRSGGFEHGGWSTPYFEDTSMKWLVDNLNEAGGFVLGRRTYELFAEHWPEAPEEEQPMAKPLNSKPKFVATKTLTEPLEWENSTVLKGDMTKAVAALKKEDGGDLLVIGSSGSSQASTSSRSTPLRSSRHPKSPISASPTVARAPASAL